MANYQSRHKGTEFDKVVDTKSMFSVVTNNNSVTVDGTPVTFNGILWNVAPTSSNTCYGVGFHPTDGQLYIIKNNKGTLTGTVVTSGTSGIESIIDQIEAGVETNTAGSHNHTASIAQNTVYTDSTSKTYQVSIDKGTNNANVKAVVPSYNVVEKRLATTAIIGIDSSNNSVTASKATAGTAKNVASAGTAVKYGTADKATNATTVAVRDTTAKKIGNADVDKAVDVVTGVSVVSTAPAGTAEKLFKASYDSTNERISFSARYISTSTDSITPAVQTNNTIYGCSSTDASIYEAVDAPSDQKITPAVSNGTITPYTFTDVTVPQAMANPTTVATGSLVAKTETANVGATLVESATGATAINVLSSGASISISENNSGNLSVITGISKNPSAISVTVDNAGSHKHSLADKAA